MQGIRKIAYIRSQEYLQECDRHQKVPNRASMTDALISAYKLLTNEIGVLCPEHATENDLKVFHSEDYIHYLKALSEDGDDNYSYYGLGYDCPVFKNIFSYASTIAGGTISAARCLTDLHFKIAINWCGGWHHAKKDEAAGFCYVNDVVLGILKLREKYRKILYIDLDVHHGDGVEEAFAYTNKVMTVSLHKHETGFYPGTGNECTTGFGPGKNFSINVPLKDGIRDDQYFDIFKKVMSLVKSKFEAEAIVCQCGVDGLAGDPMEAFNLTPVAYGKCVDYLLKWNLPILFLGGGGYNIPNTVRCWTYLTSIIVRKKIPIDIPDNPYFTEFGPDFTIEITPGNRPNKNTDEKIEVLLHKIATNLNV